MVENARFNPYQDLQRNYLWHIVLPTISLSLLGQDNLSTKKVECLCQNVDVGGADIIVNRLVAGATTLKTSGLVNVAMASMLFLGTTDKIVPLYFNAWKDRVVTSRSEFRPRRMYAGDVFLIETDPEGKVTTTVRLQHAFPTKMTKSSSTYSGEGAIETYRVDFSVDDVYYS